MYFVCFVVDCLDMLWCQVLEFYALTHRTAEHIVDRDASCKYGCCIFRRNVLECPPAMCCLFVSIADKCVWGLIRSCFSSQHSAKPTAEVSLSGFHCREVCSAFLDMYRRVTFLSLFVVRSTGLSTGTCFSFCCCDEGLEASGHYQTYERVL